MKISGSIYKLLAMCLVAAVVIGCAVGHRDQIEEQPAEMEPTDVRGFEPLELPQDNIVVPLEYPRTGEIVGQSALVPGRDLADPGEEVPGEDFPFEVDTVLNQAYRVQLFTSKLYGEARNELRVAEEIFDRPVFLDYEVPYYKLRVGNFADREKAEEYQMRARTAGYANAWVVIVNVNVKETAPMYEDLQNPTADSLGAPEGDGE